MSPSSRTSIKRLVFVALLAFQMFGATSIRAQVMVDDAWVRATVRGQQATGAFMRISTKKDVKLVEARTPNAGFVEVHQMLLEQGVMSMRTVKGLLIPAGEPVEFKSGGYHLMLMDLKQPVRAGFESQITLVFESSDGKRESIYVHAPIANTSPHKKR
jgi:copper(I)-binding protein